MTSVNTVADNNIKKQQSSSTHYLKDTIRFDVSSKGPSSGISVILTSVILETSNRIVSFRQ